MSQKGSRHKYLRYDEKCFIVKQILENDVSPWDLASQIGVGDSSIRSWLKAIDFDLSNLNRLKHKSVSLLERKRPILVELPEWVQKEIIEKVASYPTMGALKLKQHFFRHHQTILSEKKIYFFLKELRYLKRPGKPEET